MGGRAARMPVPTRCGMEWHVALTTLDAGGTTTLYLLSSSRRPTTGTVSPT